MRISIIGSGHVGLVTGLCFAERGHEVLCVDHDRAKVAALQSGATPFHEPGLEALLKKHLAAKRVRFSGATAEGVEFAETVFICVGTPSTAERRVDMRFIEAVSRDIAEHLTSYRVVVEKSTVPIRTGERVRKTLERYAPKGALFDVVSNPEFLREGSAVADALGPNRIVIGAESARAEAVMRAIYKDFDAPLIVTSMQSAELIKHASNAYLAMRISFMNAMSRVCELGGADVREVARGLALDPRVGPGYLDAGIGYGGSCFPKDVDGIYHIAKDMGYDCELLRQIQLINDEQWQRFVQRIEDELWVVQRKTIALWGLAFKPNTDDVRDAPALKIAAELLRRGARVRAYDPVAGANAAAKAPGIEVCSSALDAAHGADALALCTEWPEFREVSPEKVRAAVAVPLMFDGRNYLDDQAWSAAGFTYFGVGR